MPTPPSNYDALMTAAKKLNKRERAALAAYEDSDLAKHGELLCLPKFPTHSTHINHTTTLLPTGQANTFPAAWKTATETKVALAVAPLIKKETNNVVAAATAALATLAKSTLASKPATQV